ncbi:DUF58 domain-containing protein [Actinoalloteichus sp. AHMU CJ021]|uniref:Uncharacterized conserved protein, DUF58 family, contains vWF domain n=1 Tax=Actinoalloteichus caeruleus DSM 43889 TaxID=1120930 RepID=A0ABT1JQ36_ACTCY|nr:DUF58 domain-containing protein [Actinoalloteichus caeruleus]AUS80239.1 DUF58 domain-containing protein [Actinoalloteichus sp. AHMU CJ021]MCP2334472.1 Uncharacterized conserved protein, DUF58 family, contains vWF domain [Actinoalloteichus caeruleus DSM 43889]
MTALSGLTTRGRCLFAAGTAAALCSVVLDERDLLRVGLFTLLLPLLSALVTRRSRTQVSVERAVSPARVQAGDLARMRLTVRGRGTLGGGTVLLQDTLPYALGERPRFLAPRPVRGQCVVLTYELRPTLRGVHTVGPLAARFTDAFGLAEHDEALGEQLRFVVTPRVEELAGHPAGSGTGRGEEGIARARSGQGLDDVVVRPYRHGDDMRRVHWRSTARRDELMVRVEESPWVGGTTVLVDVRNAAHRGTGPASSLEWAVSFTASVCLHLRSTGKGFRLLTNEGVPLLSEDVLGSRSDAVVLDTLARLAPSRRRELALEADPAEGRDLVAVLGMLSADEAHRLAVRRPPGSRTSAVLLDVRQWAGLGDTMAPSQEPAARVLRAAGWRVVTPLPGEEMVAVWSRLCGRGAEGPPATPTARAVWHGGVG